MAKREEEYNWLDDPFNDKKSESKMQGKSKAFVGVGCLVAIGLVVALLVLFVMTISGLASGI